MDDESTSRELSRHLVTTIVSSYVKHNRVGANDLSTLIASVHQSLSGLGKPVASAEIRTPAVPVRRSVQQDYVVCLECGFRGHIIRRHLLAQHGLDPGAYRARWKLPPDHPLTAPAYSQRRSALAKQIGLGRRRRAAEIAPEPEPLPSPKRRRTRSSAKEQVVPST